MGNWKTGSGEPKKVGICVNRWISFVERNGCRDWKLGIVGLVLIVLLSVESVNFRDSVGHLELNY